MEVSFKYVTEALENDMTKTCRFSAIEVCKVDEIENVST